MDKVLESGQDDQSVSPPEGAAKEPDPVVVEPSESTDETIPAPVLDPEPSEPELGKPVGEEPVLQSEVGVADASESDESIESRTQFVDDGSTRSFSEWLASVSGTSVEEAPESGAGDGRAEISEPAGEESLLGGAGSRPLADHDPQAAPRPVAPAEDMGVLSGLISKQRQKAQELRGAAASPVNKPPARATGFNDPQTETYASILAAQGKFDRARAIYEALSLKNPDKSSYFAGLIDELDKRSGDGE
jgi:hypothetical protein